MVTIEAAEWDDFFRHSLDVLKNSARYLQTAFSVFGFRDVIQHFSEAQGPNGAWPARRDKKTHRLLQDKGNLRSGFLPTNTKQIDNLTIKFFNPVPYSGFQNWGTKYIPRREFMWLSDEAKEKISNYILDELVK